MPSEPGKVTRAATQGAVDGTISKPDVAGPEGIPGKSTLVVDGQALPTKASDIGDRYIEGREACAAGGPGCFLDATTRGRLVDAYQQEVRIAEAFYVQALTEIGIERMIKKEEELPAIITLSIELFTGYVFGTLGKALGLLRTKGEREIGMNMRSMIAFQEGAAPAPPPSLVRAMLADVEDSDLGTIVKAVGDQAKKGIKASARPPGATDGKAVALGYLDELKGAAAIAFEHQAQDPPGYVTDAQLVVLFHAFKAEMGHTLPAYKQALIDKLKRFEASPASKIGREHHHQLHDPDDKRRWFDAVMRDTKVVWVVIPDDPVPHLYYYKQDFAYGPESSGKELEPGAETGMAQLDEHFRPDKAVEEEFASTAIARHTQVWGKEPETKTVERRILAVETSNPMLLAEPRPDVSAASKPRPMPAGAKVTPTAKAPAAPVADPANLAAPKGFAS